MVIKFLLGFFCFLFSLSVWAESKYCFVEAGRYYGIDPYLLAAIAKVESGFRTNVYNRTHSNKTSSVDIGLMQINSRWLSDRRLISLGYRKEHLLDGCTNTYVGAWILADNFRNYGYSWNAVGAYNASCRSLSRSDCIKVRNKYSWDVYKAMLSLKEEGKR